MDYYYVELDIYVFICILVLSEVKGGQVKVQVGC